MVFDSSKGNRITDYLVFNNSRTAEKFSNYLIYENLLQFSFSDHDLTHLKRLPVEAINSDLLALKYCTRMKHFQVAIKNIDELKTDNHQIKLDTIVNAYDLIEKEITESCEQYFREKLMSLPESTHRIIRDEVLPKVIQGSDFMKELYMTAPMFLNDIDSIRDEVEQYDGDLEYEAVKEIVNEPSTDTGENKDVIGVQMVMTSVRPKR